jgi:rRNA maturation endonuclease Nob1
MTKIVEERVLKNGKWVTTKIKLEGCEKVSDEALVESGICPDCGRQLPEPVTESREGGYSEPVTYCPCGATFTGEI